MKKIDERNQQAREFLDKLYENAINAGANIDESAYRNSIDRLFDTTSWGLREILLVVVIGMHLDRAYKASTGLYDCNPRALFPGPIREFLIEKDIPHRKDGPLNIAKAIVGLDYAWAAKKRPAAVAKEVVNIVNYMEENPSSRDERVFSVGTSLIKRLISYANKLESLSVELKPSADPEFLYHLCYELITKTPDAGNTPQKISAFLLKNYHLSMKTGVVVTGEEDRASVTSTTSKKPGDVNEESSDGLIYKVYEVTVKPFNLARIRDSFDCVRIYNESNSSDIHEIIVICRPEDCPNDMKLSGLQEYMGSFDYQNIIYYFWNIYEWISATLQRMTEDARTGFYNDLNSYIDDINTAEAVKELWHKLHEQ